MTAPAEVFHISEFLTEELLARGWTTEGLVMRMGTTREFGVDLICVDLLMCVHDENLIINDETFAGFSRAFGVSEEFFRNFHQTWLDHPDKRAEFEAPEEIFGPVSRSMILPVRA